MPGRRAVLGPSWGRLGALVGPSWGRLGPSWPFLWPSWGFPRISWGAGFGWAQEGSTRAPPSVASKRTFWMPLLGGPFGPLASPSWGRIGAFFLGLSWAPSWGLPKISGEFRMGSRGVQKSPRQWHPRGPSGCHCRGGPLGALSGTLEALLGPSRRPGTRAPLQCIRVLDGRIPSTTHAQWAGGIAV